MRFAGRSGPSGGEGHERGARRLLSWEPLGSSPFAVGWPSSFPLGGLALPYSIIVLTSTQVLPTDDTNCRVPIWAWIPFTVDVSEPKPNGQRSDRILGEQDRQRRS